MFIYENKLTMAPFCIQQHYNYITSYPFFYFRFCCVMRKSEQRAVSQRFPHRQVGQQTIRLHDVGRVVLYDVTCAPWRVVENVASDFTRRTASDNVHQRCFSRPFNTHKVSSVTVRGSWCFYLILKAGHYCIYSLPQVENRENLIHIYGMSYTYMYMECDTQSWVFK